MKNLALAIAAPLLAVTASAQHVGFQVAAVTATSGTQISGFPCDPFSCTPATVMADAGTSILLRTKGASWQPHFLFVSNQTLPCVTIPGFGNALMMDGPASVTLLDLTWAMIYVSGVGPVCGGRIGSTYFDLPAGLPSGAGARMQLFAPWMTVDGPLWTFSNAVDLTIS